MRLGFSGTRHGMTERQRAELDALLRRLSLSEFHHGDCIGADAQAVALVRECQPAVRIICHPPSNSKLRAYVKSDFVFRERSYLTRNRDIVDATDMLVAAPNEAHERMRSGTWSTWRYAQRSSKPTLLLLP